MYRSYKKIKQLRTKAKDIKLMLEHKYYLLYPYSETIIEIVNGVINLIIKI
jgi:hypothetical protein